MIEQEWKNAVEELARDAFKRFIIHHHGFGECDAISNKQVEKVINQNSTKDWLDNVRLKRLPELFTLDVEFYGYENAAKMWEWQYKDRAHLDEWFKCDKPVNFENPKITYRRKISAALPFDLERANADDVVQFYCGITDLPAIDVTFISQSKSCAELIYIKDKYKTHTVESRYLRMKYPPRIKKND